MPEYIRVTYVRSGIGRNYRQRKVLKALGLSRLQQSRVVIDNPSIRGMINKIPHLLTVEAVDKPVMAVKTKIKIPKDTETLIKAKPKTSKKPKDTEPPVKAKPKTSKKPKDTEPQVEAKPQTKKKSKAKKPDKSEVSEELIKDDAVAPVTEAETTEEPADVKDEDTETGSNA